MSLGAFLCRLNSKAQVRYTAQKKRTQKLAEATGLAVSIVCYPDNVSESADRRISSACMGKAVRVCRFRSPAELGERFRIPTPYQGTAGCSGSSPVLPPVTPALGSTTQCLRRDRRVGPRGLAFDGEFKVLFQWRPCCGLGRSSRTTRRRPSRR